MLEWLNRWRPAKRQADELDTASAAPLAPLALSGKSAPLHKYLAARYAEAVILTFAQIEDLAGFALPELARVSNDWWTAPASHAAANGFADSWIKASRTARPNLLAGSVVFDRVPESAR